jgi:CRISPR-associated protein Cmr4
MHVGSGKENSGIVDNTIQRDVLTKYPVINSTSLKGALREYFVDKYSEDDRIIKNIFGKGNEKKNGMEVEDETGKNSPGKFNFFSANLLSIPARSDKFSFLNASTVSIIGDLLKQVDLLNNEDNKIIPDNDYNTLKKLSLINCSSDALCLVEEIKDAVVEFYNVKAQYCNSFSTDEINILKKWLGENFVIVKKDVFEKNIINKLPVIARNHLDNGQSTNLWYEEIIPRQTRFYTFISAKESDWKNESNFNICPVQIGANASVGYGFSRIFQPEKKED